MRVGALGYWPVLVMYAVRTGFAGALSTVSTFVAEVSCVPVAATTQSNPYWYDLERLMHAAGRATAFFQWYAD